MHEYLTNLIKEAIELKASDIYLSTSKIPFLKIKGQIKKLENIEIITKENIEKYIKSFLNENLQKKLENESQLTFSIKTEDKINLKINIFTYINGLALNIHILPNEIPNFNDLFFPKILKEIIELKSGLIVFSGPPNSGKTTSLFSVLNEINQNKELNIITFEKELSYEIKDIKSIIHQREIPKNIENLEKANNCILNQNINCIVIGDMNKNENALTALNFAEMGFLVMSTMNANNGVIDAITKLIDSHSNKNLENTLFRIANNLKFLIYQQLINEKNSEKITPIYEILINNNQISSLIRQNKIHQIKSTMELCNNEGMQTFEQALQTFSKNI